MKTSFTEYLLRIVLGVMERYGTNYISFDSEEEDGRLKFVNVLVLKIGMIGSTKVEIARFCGICT